MLSNNLKNIVVLKNLPSNLIEEAIVVVKSNKTAKRLQFIKKNSKISYNKSKNNDDDYVIKEAESVISNYISKMEERKNYKMTKKNIEVKYKKIKIYSIVVSILLLGCILKVLI